jgi:hypothetical protein
MYHLFLDDERFPAKNWDDIDHKIVRNYDEAIQIMSEYGCPLSMSFDHDLGDPKAKTGYDVVKWMVEQDLNSGKIWFRKDFTFYVHSQNPVGGQNIQRFLENYFNFAR